VRVNLQHDPRISQTFDMAHSQGGLMVGGDLELALKVFMALSQEQ
jgi:hypothetical protein